MGLLLIFSTFIMCYLASRLHNIALLTATAPQNKSIDELVRDRARKYCDPTSQGYTGRSTVQ